VSTIAGAVLVGGASRRMGRDKASIPVRGVPLASLVGQVLADAGCSPVIAVGADRPSSAAGPFERWVADAWPGAGPLGAVVTALEATGADTLVAACDLPGLDPTTVGRLLGARVDPDVASVVVACTDRRQPALAIWNRAALPILRTGFLGGERSLRAGLGLLAVVEVEVDAEALHDVDTPEDLRGHVADR
jgi:molybdopterin-guanine dinucleotide biosynthesis protein A